MSNPPRVRLAAPAIDAVSEDTPPATASLGQRLRGMRPLTDLQIEQILLHQRQSGLRFGDAAVALKLASRDEVAQALSQQFNFPYVASGNHTLAPELVTALAPFSEQAEVFRDLRTRLLLEHLDAAAAPTALAVVSADRGDGKTYLAANLAISLSQMGRRTLLVDADLRTPRLHQAFGLDNHGGLSGVLAAHQQAADMILTVPGLPSLEFLPSGGVPPNPQELLQRPTFTLLMQEFLSRFDHVIVDTPAASHGADARLLALKCGAALIVTRRGKSKVRDLQTLIAALSRSATRIAGVLVNER